VKEILEIPENIEVIGLITLGYPGENAETPPRVELEKIVHWESWSNVRRQTFGDNMVRSGPLSLIKKFLGKGSRGQGFKRSSENLKTET
jgi:hypothetical protein